MILALVGSHIILNLRFEYNLSSYGTATQGWASIGVAALAGWVVEVAVKWAVGWVLSHFQ
jgi:hypothetical protein